MPPTSSARPISPPMLAKTIPITRLAVQFDRGRAALAAVFEVGRCSPPSVIRQAYVARELDTKTDGLHAKVAVLLHRKRWRSAGCLACAFSAASAAKGAVQDLAHRLHAADAEC